MDVALTALYLAGKAEETHKKLTPFLQAAFLVLNPSRGLDASDVRITNEHRVHVTKYEHSILLAVNFNFCCEHVHTLALRLLAARGPLSAPLEPLLESLIAFIKAAISLPTVVLCFPPSLVAEACVCQALSAAHHSPRVPPSRSDPSRRPNPRVESVVAQIVSLISPLSSAAKG